MSSYSIGINHFQDGYSALMTAISNKSIDIVKVLLDAGADYDQINEVIQDMILQSLAVSFDRAYFFLIILFLLIVMLTKL